MRSCVVDPPLMCLRYPITSRLSSRLDFVHRYSLGRCIKETCFIHRETRERICIEYFASESIEYKNSFTLRKEKHYATVGTRLLQLDCAVCSRYLGTLRLLSECTHCNELFFDFIQVLTERGDSFYEQQDPVILVCV